MSLSRTLTTFVVDISPTMGHKRVIREEFVDDDGNVEEKERETTNLAWCLEFVARKTQSIIFSGLKTAQMSLIAFGSPRTSNAVIDAEPDQDAYQGVDELVPMGQPTVATLELLRGLRAVREDEGGHPPDSLDALICALTSMSDPSRGGVAPTSRSWKRVIYLITDGRCPINQDSVDAIAERIKEDGVSLRVIGVDFDDEEFGFEEEDKDAVKRENEEWWHNWLSQLPESRIASAVHALEQATLPNVQLKGSAPYSTALTFGDPEEGFTADTAMHIPVKMFKLTTRVLPMPRKTLSKLAEQTEAARREKEATQQAQSQYISDDGAFAPTPTPNLPAINTQDGISRTYMVDVRRLHFLAEQVKELGTENAQPLRADAEQEFSKAYKLGASLIPITPDIDVQWESAQGLEIINWVKDATFRRHYLLGEIWNVFADANNLKAQVQLSSLAKAMRDQGKLALVRFVRKENAEPKIGILYPVLRIPDESTADYFHFSEVPFSEDLKRYTFPSLDRVITADGRELKVHRSLPTDSMVRAMEGLVDSMDLMHAFKDEDGEDQPWFSTEDSFNPAIHRMKEAVAYRVMHPDSTDLPRPHWEVDKFLDRPEEIREASRHWAEKCRNLFNIRYYPDKATIKARMKRERDLAEKTRRLEGRHELDLGQAGDDDEQAGSGSEGPDAAQRQDTQEPKRIKAADGQSQPARGKLIDSDSGTEDEEEEELLAPTSSRMASSSRDDSVKKEPLSQTQTQAQSQKEAKRPGTVEVQKDSTGEVSDDDEEEAPPEIRILAADPVGSFHFYLEDPKMDQGAVIRALQKTIVELVIRGDAAGADKAVDALRAGKKAAAEYDEAQEWNTWMRRFKTRLVSSRPGDTSGDADEEGGTRDEGVAAALSRLSSTAHGSFWETHVVGEVDIGLITRDEDESGRSRVTEDEARDFLEA